VLGTIVNTLAIVCGSLIGLVFRGKVPEQYRETVIYAISLAVLLIGLQGALKSREILLVISSLAVGSVMGEWLRIERRLEMLGSWLEARFSRGGSDLARGFVTTSLIYCVGSMAIVGSLESGLAGNHRTLFAKSILDGIGSVVFASTFGIGVLFSAVTVFVYQGAITLAASMVRPLLTPTVITEMSAVGGLLIMAIAINLLEIKRLKVGNMLPAIFIPLIYYLIRRLF